MSFIATPDGWARCLPTEWYESRKPPMFLRDTNAGKQYLFVRPEVDVDGHAVDVYWLELEGWEKPLYCNYELKPVLDYAVCCEGTDLLRIANLSKPDFAHKIFECTVIALEALVAGTYKSAEAGRECIGKAETLFTMLRNRLLDKCDKESIASQAERYAARFQRLTYLFFATYTRDMPEHTTESLQGLEDTVEVLRRVFEYHNKTSKTNKTPTGSSLA